MNIAPLCCVYPSGKIFKIQYILDTVQIIDIFCILSKILIFLDSIQKYRYFWILSKNINILDSIQNISIIWTVSKIYCILKILPEGYTQHKGAIFIAAAPGWISTFGQKTAGFYQIEGLPTNLKNKFASKLGQDFRFFSIWSREEFQILVRI